MINPSSNEVVSRMGYGLSTKLESKFNTDSVYKNVIVRYDNDIYLYEGLIGLFHFFIII